VITLAGISGEKQQADWWDCGIGERQTGDRGESDTGCSDCYRCPWCVSVYVV